MNANPMFNPQNNSRKIVTSKIRKTRSDKKKDVKIPVDEFQRKEIRLSAFENNLTTTQYISKLITEYISLSYISEIHSYDYKDTKRYIHAKLNQEIHKKLVHLAIEWGVSQREAATRILRFALKTM